MSKRLNSRPSGQSARADGSADRGLVAHGPDPADVFLRTAEYVGRILRGTNPGDLPAQSPIMFLLTIDMKIARAFELTISPPLLATPTR